MLDPQARTLLQLMVERGVPAFNAQTPVEARQAYLMRKGFTQPDLPEMSLYRDHQVAMNGTSVTIREFRPPGVAASAVLPALVYYHGGGWVIGDVDTHDVLCRQLCQASGCAVFSVDYRLAPEHVFPAAYDDAQAAFQWVAANALSLHVDAKRIAVGGDSAGGNLAATVCLGARGGTHQPAFQLLIYPATLMYPDTQSYRDNGEGYALTAEVMDWFMDHYLPSRDLAHDWRASPLKAGSHAGLPPALVLTAGFDPLRDEGRLYADALSAAGGSAEYICFERQIHGFITMGRVMREAHTGVAVCAGALKRYLS
ncbi:MAG: alpha/beta hydrolase [Limnohabitans sp.]|nr:alpha/beta hydrolase [Limnohabitans sp.]